jgi:hypothetical protein
MHATFLFVYIDYLSYAIDTTLTTPPSRPRLDRSRSAPSPRPLVHGFEFACTTPPTFTFRLASLVTLRLIAVVSERNWQREVRRLGQTIFYEVNCELVLARAARRLRETVQS